MSSESAIDSAPEHSSPECSLIIPVYRNRDSIDALVDRLVQLDSTVDGGIEAVIVVDGCPQHCERLLAERLAPSRLKARLVVLSRNFGSFEAIRKGLELARGRFFAIMSADLQEPAELFETLFSKLRSGEAEVAVGTRRSRDDPWPSRTLSRIFWSMQKRLVEPALPSNGVDIFGCNRAVRDALLTFYEARTSLVGQLYWLGFRRIEVPYDRLPRVDGGRSGWSFRRKWNYLLDSLFSFTDLPIRVFTWLGGVGLVLGTLLGLIVLAARLSGQIEVPGYTPIILAVLFFSSLNLFGLGIIGNYVWRSYENTKKRPLAVVREIGSYPPENRP